MLSISTLSSAHQAGSYYGKENYYAKSSAEAREASAWFGDGAKSVGYVGEVENGDFIRVLQGRVPGGGQLGRVVDGEVQHAPGVDLTFSAPKSVSILGLVADDKRVLEAHDDAVKAALGWVEKNLIQTRVMIDGKVKTVGNQSMVAATFRHDTNRNLEPQLHTHAVIANMVRDNGDGTWRSLHNPALYDSKMLVGQMYRAELAQRLHEMGYEIRLTHKDGRFEIASIPQELIDEFSSRAREIRTALDGYDHQNAKTAAVAALVTRQAKRTVSPTELAADWRARVSALGVSLNKATEADATVAARLDAGLPTTVREAMEQGGISGVLGYLAERVTDRAPRVPQVKAETAQQAVDYAVRHLSERNSAFELDDVRKEAMTAGLGRVSVTAIEGAIAAARSSGKLLDSKVAEHRKLVTTPTAVAMEKEVIQLMREGRGVATPVVPTRADEVAKRLAVVREDGKSLNAGQIAASTMILTSRDRFVAVQGYAGVGKTTMYQTVREVSDENGFRWIGLAPTASAAATLAEEAGIEARTLQSFLANHEKFTRGDVPKDKLLEAQALFARTGLLVDEDSLASTAQARDLKRIANALKLPKVVLSGDEKQLGAVEAGKPFAQLQRAGITTAEMKEIQRQKNSPELKAAVEHSIAGEVRAAFAKLGSAVEEHDSPAAQAAAHWLSLSAEDRARTLIVAPANETRRQINEAVRNQLVLEGQITGSAITINTLRPANFTGAQQRATFNYKNGQVVVFNRSYDALGVEKDEHWQVSGIDQRRGVVTLHKDGRTVKWKPQELAAGRSGAVSVYDRDKHDLQQGDRIQWTKNDKEKVLINSHTATILAVDGRKVTVRLQNGKEIDLARDDPRLAHMDYAHAATAHAAQGRTVDHVIGVLESWRRNLSNQKVFYVTISRARTSARLFVDDAKALGKQLQKVTGEKISALETQGHDLAADQHQHQHQPAPQQEHARAMDFGL
ncbi:MobF family relaxase [Azospirillum sp. A23]|uniref:MobF family relaxase n=1 Tax=Azospirillum sp. A23 TaxID=3160608 RepID=UPI0036F21DDE